MGDTGEMIFAVVSFSILILWGLAGLYYTFVWKKKHPVEVPGYRPRPSNPEVGNLPEIAKAGSLHEFLELLHKRFGALASFYFGEQFVVSSSNPHAFKAQIKLFDHPEKLFHNLLPLLGPKSIGFLTGDEGRAARRQLDQVYTKQACDAHIPMFLETANSVADRWLKEGQRGNMQIPLREEMIDLALRIITRASFGNDFAVESVYKQMGINYDITMGEMDDNISKPGEALTQRFYEAVQAMRSQIQKSAENRRNNFKSTSEGRLLIDEIIDISASDKQICDHGIAYFVAGFHTTGTLLTWLLYQLANYPEYQDTLRREFKSVLQNEQLSAYHLNDLTFAKMLVEETLRWSQLVPVAGRFTSESMQIGPYPVPKNTAFLQAFGVADYDPRAFREPERFDPERFSEDNSRYRDKLWFQPFGFAGKRKCPGHRFALVEVYSVLSVLLRRFQFELVNPDQEVTKRYGLVTHPRQEILLKLIEL